ncbi:MAG: MBL fold metallo-hydrolase [Candidatus Bathyarchaeota archaeon]|nr:MBL fold metallo-hydrolase [Candidatus Bathyarchaeota archaeon]
MKLTEKVHLVGGSGYGLSPQGDCNIYLVNGGDELALIDTGGGFGVKDILGNVKADGFDPKKITKVLITHCHFDHIGGNYDLKNELGCNIISHDSDKTPIETLDELSLYTMAQERGLEFKATKVDATVKEGDKVQVGDVSLNVVHNPGHTPGCISFLLDEDDGKRGLLCGDIAGPSGNLGYINGPGFNLDDWKMSIKKLVDLSPDRLYPGHNTFILNNAKEHLELYDQKMNAAWTTIITSVG